MTAQARNLFFSKVQESREQSNKSRWQIFLNNTVEGIIYKWTWLINKRVVHLDDTFTVGETSLLSVVFVSKD